MDIQEIARLHTKYSEPPLTIEMPIEDRSAPMLEGPSSTPAAESKRMWSRLTEGQRLAIALLIVAAVAFPIGMWTASGGKHAGEASAAKIPPTTAPAVAPASAADTQVHEWPAKAPMANAEPTATENPQRRGASGQQDSSASMEAPAASVALPVPASVAAAPTSKPTVKAPAAPAKPAATVAPVSSPAPHAVEQRRNNEIKLF